MEWFNKIKGGHRSPPGLEWKLLRKMPRIFVVGTLLPALAVLALHYYPWSGNEREVNATLGMLDYIALGVVVVHWATVLTVTIGCVIVMIMKGPAYVADAYYLNDADRPARDPTQ
jgi:hypothetical protein